MEFLKFSSGQVAVNTKYVVSLRVRGTESACQIVVTDILGTEYSSSNCQSFEQAKEGINKIIDAMDVWLPASLDDE